MKDLKDNQKGFAAIESLLIVIIIAALVGVGVYVLHAQKQTNATLEAVSRSALSTSPKITNKAVNDNDMSTWKVFSSKVEGLSFKYPASWVVAKHDLDTNSGTESLTLKATNSFQLMFEVRQPAAIDFGEGQEPFLHLTKLTVPNFGQLYQVVTEYRPDTSSPGPISSDMRLINYDATLKDGVQASPFPYFFSKRKANAQGVEAPFNYYWVSLVGNFNETKTHNYQNFINSPEAKVTQQIFKTIHY